MQLLLSLPVALVAANLTAEVDGGGGCCIDIDIVIVVVVVVVSAVEEGNKDENENAVTLLDIVRVISVDFQYPFFPWKFGNLI